MSALLMQATGLRVRFPAAGGSFWRPRHIEAVRGVDFEIKAAETLAIIGESGCGKSTLIRAAIGLQRLDAGLVLWRGDDIRGRNGFVPHHLRRDIQIIFQDPVAALDPRMSVAASIAAPLSVHEPRQDRAARRRRVDAVLERVGLGSAYGSRHPHELSGGQCQRAAIARALILNPALLVCDEPLAALDVSIQAQIVNLLLDLQQDQGLALILVSHNLPVVRRMAHRVMVMHLGKAVEAGPAAALFTSPRHPYTQALIAAVPVPDPQAAAPVSLRGEMPSPPVMAQGCGFATRCAWVQEDCRRSEPDLDRENGAHQAACWRA